MLKLKTAFNVYRLNLEDFFTIIKLLMMKQVFGIFAVFALMLAGAAFKTVDVVTYSVDLEQSKVNWKAYKVTGQHEGYVKLKSGGLEFTDSLLSGGTFEIDMTSMVVTDLEGNWKDKLEGHLKSEDFFSIEKFPTAAFKITKVTPQGPGKYKVEGDVTIKETTKSIRFTADTKEENGLITAVAAIELDRSDFNVRYGSATFLGNLGDKTIYDNFDLTVELTAKK